MTEPLSGLRFLDSPGDSVCGYGPDELHKALTSTAVSALAALLFMTC